MLIIVDLFLPIIIHRQGYEPPRNRGVGEFWSAIFFGGWAFLKS